MKMSAGAVLLSCLAILTACDPVLRDGGEAGGTVINAAGMQGRKAYALAIAHCGRFGRVVKLGALDMTSNLLAFDCVAPTR